MPFPKQRDLAEAILVHLSRSGGTASIAEIAEALAKRFRLSDQELEREAHGECEWKLRLRQAKHELVTTGKVARSGRTRGQWSLR